MTSLLTHKKLLSETSGGRIHKFKDSEPIRIQQKEIRIRHLLNFNIRIQSGSASKQLHFVHNNKNQKLGRVLYQNSAEDQPKKKVKRSSPKIGSIFQPKSK